MADVSPTVAAPAPTPLPELTRSTAAALDHDADALVVPVFRGGIEGPGADEALRALGLDDVPRDADFRGKVGETLALAAPGLRCGRVVLVGLGRMDQLDDEQVRRAAGAATRSLAESCRSVVTTLPLVNVAPATVRAAAEGALLGGYRYRYPTAQRPPDRLAEVTLVVPSSLDAAAERAVALAGIHARAQCVARDLVNLPAGDLGPDDFTIQARALLGDAVAVEVWDERHLAAQRCGGILAVGRGSTRAPRMLVARYRPGRAGGDDDHGAPIASVALVGKGIVFDSGGLSLKRPWQTMEPMKGDMSGAATVVAVLRAVAELALPIEVLAVCPLAENLPSGDAQRPGDVLTTRDGTTVEVIDTDAEGRLVLADALAYAAEHGPDAIVDVATLTGAAARALGERAVAAFGNDDDLLRQILTAAESAGEAAWHLPLWDDLRDNLESDVADLENLGAGDQGAATVGGLFLREFVAGTPWVHLDLGGAFWARQDRHHLRRGATGTPVRTLLRWLEQASA